jgi:hypothetical protein
MVLATELKLLILRISVRTSVKIQFQKGVKIVRDEL